MISICMSTVSKSNGFISDGYYWLLLKALDEAESKL